MFCVQGADSSISNLVIDRNPTTAILITGNRATVSGNYIGTDTTGELAQGNTGDGVSIVDATHASVTNNVISANTGYGVSLSGTNAKNATISNNKIGTDKDGETELGNLGDGVFLSDASNNTISNNVISGNSGHGILIIWSGATNNTITGNKIGTDADGGDDLGNSSDGIRISDNASNNEISGENVISGNTGNGIRINNSNSNKVTGNRIGVTSNAVEINPLPNDQDGILIEGNSQSNKIDGGNVISGNAKNGVHISGGESNIVEANYIGTDSNDVNNLANSENGVLIDGGTKNEVRNGNVISGNDKNGVRITGAGTNENKITNNKIGTDAAGNAALANKKDGVVIDDGAQKNTVDGNVISGNTKNGVHIFGQGTKENTISNNTIGAKANGTDPLPNEEDGVFIRMKAQSNIVKDNTISGNKLFGVRITGTDTKDNRVTGNKIGTDKTGNSKLANKTGGVLIAFKATENIIGGAGSERNIISGNTGPGVQIGGAGGEAPTKNVVKGNYIGTKVNGTEALDNTQDGVLLTGGASENLIGVAGAGNVISGNLKNGVHISGPNTNENKITENLIGTNKDGDGAVPNQENGVQIFGSGTGRRWNRVENNVISGNVHNGVRIGGLETNSNIVVDNLIGTKKNGTDPLPNQKDGVLIEQSAKYNQIGDGLYAGGGNTISGNTHNGVRITGSDTAVNNVSGNKIGVDKNAANALANGKNGVRIENYARDNDIGVDGFGGTGNTISKNTEHGVYISASKNSVKGNYIGTNAAGADLGNTLSGVTITGSSENKIGDTGANDGNTIAFNVKDGVAVWSGSDNSILRNSIYKNGDLGIDLVDNGVTRNDNKDVDNGANDLQNFPMITSRVVGGGNATIGGMLNSTPGATFRVEIFTSDEGDPSGFGEGQVFRTSVNVTTNGDGNATFNAVVPVSDYITATATEVLTGGKFGSTSEFGSFVVIDFLDDDKATRTTFAEVGKWQNGFNAGPVVGGVMSPTAKANIHELDEDRFYVRIFDPTRKGAGTIKANILTLDIDGDEADRVNQFELKETPAGSGTFISDPKLLVSHNVDDAFAAAGVADGNAKDPTLNVFSPAKMTSDPLRILLGGKVEAEYDVKTGQGPAAGAADAARGNINIPDPPSIRTVTVIAHVMRVETFNDVGFDHDANPATPNVNPTVGGFDFTDTNMNGTHNAGEPSEPFTDGNGNGRYDGAVATKAQMEQAIALANAYYAQAEIRLVLSGGVQFHSPPAAEPFMNVGYDHDANPATPNINPTAGFDYTDTNGNGLHNAGERSEPFTDSNGNGGYDIVVNLADGSLNEYAPTLTGEERNMIDSLADASANTVDIFVVNNFSSGTTAGEAFWAQAGTPGAGLRRPNVVALRPGELTGHYVLAHEIGHVLLNNGGHVPTGTAAGRVNVMYPYVDTPGVTHAMRWTTADANTMRGFAGAAAPLTASTDARVTAAPSLTQSQLRAIFEAAIAQWGAAGLSDDQLRQLRDVDVQIRDLGPFHLGLAFPSSGEIWIDDNASGHGWYIDSWPADHSEFSLPISSTHFVAPNDVLNSRIDLLTVVMHELGHVLGLPDEDPMLHPDSVMSGSLSTIVRRVPSVAESLRLSTIEFPDANDRLVDHRWQSTPFFASLFSDLFQENRSLFDETDDDDLVSDRRNGKSSQDRRLEFVAHDSEVLSLEYRAIIDELMNDNDDDQEEQGLTEETEEAEALSPDDEEKSPKN